MAILTIDDVTANVGEVAARFIDDRSKRFLRRSLERADFAELGEAGMVRLGLPASRGGLWQGLERSVRGYCNVFRVLGGADPSVALVSTMHPGVLGFWLVPQSGDDAVGRQFRSQCDEVFDSVAAGHWFGTIASEPGSSGDLMATKAVAVEHGDHWMFSGHKHMGSGSGVTSFMITVARPEREAEADLFLLDVRDRAWDGSEGIKLLAEWDGYGMAATNSHAFLYDDMPAQRFAMPGQISVIAPQVLPYISTTFCAVVVGVLDAAIAAATAYLGPKAQSLRALERREWTHALNQQWLAQSALETMISACERGGDPNAAARHGKVCISELSESAMNSLAKAVGGRAFSRSFPFGQWAQDVRALGFLRPPWGLAFDQIYDAFAQEHG